MTMKHRYTVTVDFTLETEGEPDLTLLMTELDLKQVKFRNNPNDTYA